LLRKLWFREPVCPRWRGAGRFARSRSSAGAAPRRAPGHDDHARKSGKVCHARLRSDRERSRARCTGSTRGGVGSPVIEVKLAGAVVRVVSNVDDVVRLTAVLRAVRASASRA